ALGVVGSAVGFFFQAEDGIRDFHVTGVQTCALPIYIDSKYRSLDLHQNLSKDRQEYQQYNLHIHTDYSHIRDNYLYQHILYMRRSEERRVGKEGRAGRTACVWERKARTIGPRKAENI